jgi:hypothetical protein
VLVRIKIKTIINNISFEWINKTTIREWKLTKKKSL